MISHGCVVAINYFSQVCERERERGGREGGREGGGEREREREKWVRETLCILRTMV